MKRGVLLFLILLILMLPVVEAATISGQVKDRYGNPVWAATVIIKESKISSGGYLYSATTDDKGKYVLENIPQQKLNFIASYGSSIAQTKMLEVTKAQHTLDFQLDMAAVPGQIVEAPRETLPPPPSAGKSPTILPDSKGGGFVDYGYFVGLAEKAKAAAFGAAGVSAAKSKAELSKIQGKTCSSHADCEGGVCFGETCQPKPGDALCVESDAGLAAEKDNPYAKKDNPYVKAAIVVNDVKQYDTCVCEYPAGTFTEDCGKLGKGFTHVRETTCSEQGKVVACENGCVDGACVSLPTCNIPLQNQRAGKVVAATSPAACQNMVADTKRNIEKNNNEVLNEVEAVAASDGVELALVLAVITKESNGIKNARGADGTAGLMQVPSGTSTLVREKHHARPETWMNLLHDGVVYLKQQLDAYGSEELALAAFNAGPQRVVGWKECIGKQDASWEEILTSVKIKVTSQPDPVNKCHLPASTKKYVALVQLYKELWGDELGMRGCVPTAGKAGKPVAGGLAKTGGSSCSPVCKDDFILATAKGEKDCWDEDGYCDKNTNQCVGFDMAFIDAGIINTIKSGPIDDLSLKGVFAAAKIFDDGLYQKPGSGLQLFLLMKKILVRNPPDHVKVNIIYRFGRVTVSKELYGPVVLSLLSSGNSPYVRKTAVEFLGNIKFEPAIEPLVNIITTEKDAELISQALFALQKMAEEYPEKSVLALRRVYTASYYPLDLDTAIKSGVINALGQINTPQSRLELVEMLRKEEDHGGNILGRQIMKTLAEKKSLEAIPLLVELAKSPHKPLLGFDLYRSAAIQALGGVLDQDLVSSGLSYNQAEPAVHALLDVLKSDTPLEIKVEAANALYKADKDSRRFYSLIYPEIPYLLPLLSPDLPTIKLKDYIGGIIVNYFDHPDVKNKAYFVVSQTPGLKPAESRKLMLYDPLFKRVADRLESYKNVYTNEQGIKVYDFTLFNKLSLNFVVYRHFAELFVNLNPTDQEIDSVIGYYLKKQRDFKDKVLFGSDAYAIIFTHEDSLTQYQPIKDFLLERGVRRMYPKDLKGPEAKSSIEKAIIDSKSSGKTLIWVNVHGAPTYLCLSGGIPQQELPSEIQCLGFRYDEFADLLLKRGNLKEVTLVIDSCFSYNFVDQLRKDLRTKNAGSYPTIVTETNKGKYGYFINQKSEFLSALSGAVKLEGLKISEPFLGKHLYLADQYNQEQDMAIFYAEDGNYPEEISLNSFNHEACPVCQGDSCLLETAVG